MAQNIFSCPPQPSQGRAFPTFGRQSGAVRPALPGGISFFEGDEVGSVAQRFFGTRVGFEKRAHQHPQLPHGQGEGRNACLRRLSFLQLRASERCGYRRIPPGTPANASQAGTACPPRAGRIHGGPALAEHEREQPPSPAFCRDVLHVPGQGTVLSSRSGAFLSLTPRKQVSLTAEKRRDLEDIHRHGGGCAASWISVRTGTRSLPILKLGKPLVQVPAGIPMDVRLALSNEALKM